MKQFYIFLPLFIDILEEHGPILLQMPLCTLFFSVCLFGLSTSSLPASHLDKLVEKPRFLLLEVQTRQDTTHV